MATLRMQKTVYDGLEDLQEITADTIAKWFRAYGKVAGSDDIVKMASPVAERLASLGVKSVGDLRHVTVDVYEERCCLTCIAAIRLQRHFGMVIEVLAREDAHGGVTVPPEGDPNTGVTDLDEGVDPSAVDGKAPQLPEGATEHVTGTAKTETPQTEEVLEEGVVTVGVSESSLTMNPGGGSTGGSQTTHLTAVQGSEGTDSTTTEKSEVQSLVATMSQSVSLLAQSMLQAQQAQQAIQAQQTKLLLGATQDKAKVPRLEQKTCARPSVKATMAWVRAVADVKHAVPGLTAALEAS